MHLLREPKDASQLRHRRVQLRLQHRHLARRQLLRQGPEAIRLLALARVLLTADICPGVPVRARAQAHPRLSQGVHEAGWQAR